MKKLLYLLVGGLIFFSCSKDSSEISSENEVETLLIDIEQIKGKWNLSGNGQSSKGGSACDIYSVIFTQNSKTSGSIDDFMMCKHLFGNKYKMFFGVDELILPALAMGADSFIGSTYNFMYPLYHDLLKNYRKGNKKEAQNCYFKVVQIIDTFLMYDGLAAQKAIMQMIGHDFGITKSPVLPLTNSEYTLLFEKLNKIKYFDYVPVAKS